MTDQLLGPTVSEVQRWHTQAEQRQAASGARREDGRVATKKFAKKTEKTVHGVDHDAGNGRSRRRGTTSSRDASQPIRWGDGGPIACGWQNAVMPRVAANGERPSAVLAQCVGCGLEADGRFTVAENWTWWADGQGALVPHCPACSHRRFGHRTTLMDDLLASARDPLRQDSGDPGS